MPPYTAEEGLAFLQHLIEYAETVVYPGGKCTCGKPIDFTIEAQLQKQPDGTNVVTAYVLECLSCHVKHVVAARVLETYVAGQREPSKVKVACGVCAEMVPDNLVTDINGVLHCEGCHTVQHNLGNIVEVITEAIMEERRD